MRFDFGLEKNVNSISALELKQLLVQLASMPTICFRFRLIGEMWVKNFLQVCSVSDRTALFYDEVETKYYLLRINNIMQFEIDARLHNYQPHFHYNVTRSPELEEAP
jgi:hypothetical protein